VSYHSAGWASIDTFVTASTTGGLQLWDTRKKSCRQSDLKWGITGASQDIGKGTAPQIQSIATHPSQPDKCASGSSSGTVAVWDLRFTSAPVVATTGKQNAGDVWQVQFDADYETRARQTPSVLFCTGDGLLSRAQWEDPSSAALTQVQVNRQHRSSGNGARVTTLLSEPSSVNGFDAGGMDGSEIVAVVDQECVCYLKRRTQSF